MKRLYSFALSLGLVAVLSGSALAYDFPNTNDYNIAEGLPHVVKMSDAPGEVTLKFVNDTNSLAFFEYRIDGQIRTSGNAHPVVTGDYIYPGVCVDNRATPAAGCVAGDSETRTFDATEKVEVRLALGGERDWDFDWTEFDVAAAVGDKVDCMSGGWKAFGFENQGQCVRFVTSGKDSR